MNNEIIHLVIKTAEGYKIILTSANNISNFNPIAMFYSFSEAYTFKLLTERI